MYIFILNKKYSLLKIYINKHIFYYIIISLKKLFHSHKLNAVVDTRVSR